MQTTTTRTADDILAQARAAKPGVRYAKYQNGNAIAAFDESLGRWVAVAALTLLGTWAACPMELLINGRPVYDQALWIE